jgi:hypothetical protein
LSLRRCPIPKCREKMGTNAFFCPAHKKLIPPELAAAIAKTQPLWKAAPRGGPDRALYAATLRQALAFAFAAICEQLKVDLPKANVQDLRQAISKELH